MQGTYQLEPFQLTQEFDQQINNYRAYLSKQETLINELNSRYFQQFLHLQEKVQQIEEKRKIKKSNFQINCK